LFFAVAPFRVAIMGLTHGHVDGFMNRNIQRDDWELVGVFEVIPKPANAYWYALPNEILKKFSRLIL